MKLVNHETFIEMPRGTVFRKWEPNVYEDVHILLGKVGTNDFNYYSLTGETDVGDLCEYGTIDKIKNRIPNLNGIEVVFGPEESYRDGCFGMDNQMYAVYEKKEVESMINMLQEALIVNGE